MPRARAFTLVELLIALVVAAVFMAVLIPAFTPRRCCSSRQLKDSSQIRGIHQALVLAAQSNQNRYPLPGDLDAGDATVGSGQAKDLPRHMLSYLIYNGFISPELCVSPAEANRAIRVFEAYQYTAPAAAAGPNRNLALWDPAFKATPIDADATPATAGIGHNSYAFMPPVGARRNLWSVKFNAAQAIVGNRGPGYVGGGGKPWKLMPTAPTGSAPGGAGSLTLLIHGGRATWEGNVAYDDNHVNFETRPDPETLPFTFNAIASGRRVQFDNLFVNENDATGLADCDSLDGAAGVNTNNFLRLWHDATMKEGTISAIKPWYD